MTQSDQELHVYLNDHLAGSVAAIELLDDLIEHHPAHRLAKFLGEMRDDIARDQQTLQELIKKLGGEESTVRKAAAWMTEKLSRIKMRFSGESTLGLLQAFETLVLGVTGKELLWRALAAISSTSVELQGFDFDQLEARAQAQIEQLESERLQLAREVLSDREHS